MEWSREDAENALAALKLKIEQPKAKGAGMTLAQAAERYLAAKARKRWLQGDRWLLAHLVAALGADTPLSEITASRISEYQDSPLASTSEKTKRPLKAAGINRPLALLRHLLRLAHEKGKSWRRCRGSRSRRSRKGIRWLEPDEEARLLAACATSHNKHLLAMVTVALETGLRKGELLGLTWDRIDLSQGLIRIEQTKSGGRRAITMLRRVYDTLAALPGPREGRVWTARNIRAGFENAVDAAGIDDFKFHDLRHHFASWYVMDGGSLQVLQQILGHSTLAMTMRYAHLSPQHVRADVAKVEAARESRVAENRAQDRAMSL